MANRKIILATNEFYHIFNRTIGNELIFNNKHNLNRFIALIDFYRFKTPISFSHFIKKSEEERKKLWPVISSNLPLVEIFCFAFMPNHYHLLLRQLQNDGIEIFISNIQNAFAKFFNTKYNRKGSLFCHNFERVLIQTEEQFIHVSRYIHLNPVTSYIIKLEELDKYPFTSFPVYLGKKNLEFVNKSFLLNHFKSTQRYKDFVYNQSDYQRKLHKIKSLILEERYQGLKLNNLEG